MIVEPGAGQTVNPAPGAAGSRPAASPVIKGPEQSGRPGSIPPLRL